MSPMLLQVLNNVQTSLQRDLDILEDLVNKKKTEYIKITSLIYHISDDIEAMQSGEPIVINCDPQDVDEEGRLI